MAEIVISIAAKVAELLVVPIGKQVCYPFKYKGNMEELKQQVRKLTLENERVQHDVNEAKRRGDEIEKDVEEWLNSVDEFTKGVEKFINEDEEEAKKQCFIGLCPNPMTRYSLSKKAEKAAKEGVDLLEQGKFNKVSYRPVLGKTTSIYIRGYGDFDSRRPVFDDLMEALTNVDVNLIGVYGMGGVGKTTLVKRVVGQAIQDKLFDVVVMCEVTETPNIRDIQGEIADELGLKFDEESLSGRAMRLRARLKKERRALIVLDNIWAKLDLDVVGIPLTEEEKISVLQEEDEMREEDEMQEEDERQCKLLLTSRNLNVLHDDMNTQKNFLVQILSEEEPINLFWKIVADSRKESDFRHIAVEIMKYCAGLPLAIVTIANALKNKSLSDWKNALDQLRRSSPIHIRGMDAKVYSAIKLSYEFLESEEEKSLFRLCSLHNPSSISRYSLLICGMGFDLFPDVSTLEQARNRLLLLINNLKASCLLLDGKPNKIFKMHDIIHAVAVSIASTDKLMFNIHDVTDLKEVLEEKMTKDLIAMSVQHKHVSILPERLEYPKLKLLLLSTKDTSIQISNAFFEGTKELKVLRLTKFDLLSLPSSLGGLINLQTLTLNRCQLRNVAIIGELKRLEILSFFGCNIEHLPREIGQLTRLRLLDLGKCSKLEVISPNVISSLIRLEELYMDESYFQWEIEGQSNASLLELKQLSRLTVLNMHVLDASILPPNLLLIFEKLERHNLLIGDVWDWSSKYETSRMFKLKLNNSIYLGNGVIKLLLNRTEDLHLDELKGVKNVLYELNSEGFQQLKHLHLQNGLEIQYIVNSIEGVPENVFPRLESLFLHKLIKLEKIYHGQIAIDSFSKLRIMKVEKCDRLKHLFSFSMARNLLQLQEVEVIDCKKLEEIVFMESEELVHQKENFARIEFTQLRTLTLRRLPRLSSFGLKAFIRDTGSQEILAEDEPGRFVLPFSQNILLPILENLKLSSINIGCKWLDQLPAMSSCCRSLTNLALKDCCGNLKFLFSHSMVQSLVLLEKLEILDCKSIEGIINTEDLKGEEDMIEMMFPKLLNLQLIGLPELIQFGSGNSVEFPSLTQLSIKDCPKLKTFSYAVMSVDIKQSKEVEEKNCQDGIYPLIHQKVVLPTLVSLNLSSIGIQTIWHNRLEAISSSLCFQNLKDISIFGCHNDLKYVFSSSMVKNLIQLKFLEISNCMFMERVIITEQEEKHRTLFPKLIRLMLKDLPELTCFCNFTRHSTEFPSLARLVIDNCPKMNTFISYMPANKEPEEMHSESEENLHSHILFDVKVGLPCLKFLHIKRMDNLGRIWNNQLSFNSFCTLESLWVDECKNLLNVFPSNMLVRLQKLAELQIVSCDKLEEIFELQSLSCGETQAITTIQLRRLVLRHLPNLKHVWNTQSQRFLCSQNLRSVEVRGCDSLKSIFPASIAGGLLQLKELRILDCCLVEEVFTKEDEQVEATPHLVFPELTFLNLYYLPRLKSFYPGLFISEWPALKKLLMFRCGKVKILTSEFSSFQETHRKSQLKNSVQHPLFLVHKVAFPNLEQLILGWSCIVKEMLNGNFSDYSGKLKVLKLIQEDKEKETAICPCCFLYTIPNLEELGVIYGFLKEMCICEDLGCKEKHAEALGKLRHLTLFNFKDSLHLWDENSVLCKVFQNLTTIKLTEFPHLKTLVPSSVSFQNLTSLEVSRCERLCNLVAVSTAKSLVQLEKLNVSECKEIKEIIIHKGDEMEDQIVLKKLRYLGLHCLPRLESFYSGNHAMEFPYFEQIVVRQCPKMKKFSQGILNTPRLHRLQKTEADEEGIWEGNLNTTIEHLFIESSNED